MVQQWRSILLSLSAISLLIASCGKKISKDDPLPVTYSPSVIINSDNQVMYAYDPISGTKHWELSFAYLPHISGTDYTPSPVCYNGKIYMAAVNSDTIYKINGKTGIIELKIHEDFQSYSSIATPAVDGKNIYLAGLNGYIYAVDTNGELQWKYNTGSAIESSPTIYNGQVYVATTGGHVLSLDKVNGPDGITGMPTWDYPGVGVNMPMPARFVSSIAVGDPYLFVGSVSDSNMYCIYITPPDFAPPTPPVPPYTGFLRWTYKTNGKILSSPAAYGGYCIFGSTDYYLYKLDTTIDPYNPILPVFTPRPVWKTHTSSQIFSSPLPSHQVIYVGSSDQNLYAVNILNGSVKWACHTNGLIKSSPVVYGPYVYIGSYDKYLYAVDTATGSVKWSANTNGTIECSPIIDNLTSTYGFNSQISGLTN